MTYANDSNEMRRQQHRRGLKRIEDHTDQELKDAIDKAFRKFGDDFYLLLHGIDAYQERRQRRRRQRQDRRRRLTEFLDSSDIDAIWGQS